MIGEHDAPTGTGGPVRKRERRTLKAAAGLTVVVLGVLGFASYKLVAGAGHSPKPAATHPIAAEASTPRTRPPSPAPSPSASTASASPTVAAPRTLKPVSAQAFGPAGPADGDGTEQAGFAIDGNTATNWRTDWYATPRFGDLQPGTGLLIDMGRTEAIASVQVTLGGARGANLEIRAGNTTGLASMAQVATSSGAGGALSFKLPGSVHARYLLLWFTALPPDGVGTYQALVYEVSVTGQP